MDGGTSTATRASATMLNISSTNSGLPPAVATIRCRNSAGSGLCACHPPMSWSVSESLSGSRSIEVALILPPAQCGRVSKSSGRARAMMRIGASRDQSAMYSTRSRKVDAAH
jgi:hypothetical protein